LTDGIAKVRKRNTWEGRKKLASPWWVYTDKLGYYDIIIYDEIEQYSVIDHVQDERKQGSQ